MISEMEAKISELDNKFKALNMILEKTNDAESEHNKASLLRNERSINNKVAALYVLKEEIEDRVKVYWQRVRKMCGMG